MRIKFSTIANLSIGLLFLSMTSCKKETVADPTVEANIKKYSAVWDAIINQGKLDQFSTTNFAPKVLFHSKPTDIVGIEDARAYYANYITGFSNIKFTITDIFGQGNKLTKHWKFTGVHTGDFFGIPATGKTASVEGSTIVRMENGIIMEEQDFFDNLDLLTQLGLYP